MYNGEFPYRKVLVCPECRNTLLGSASKGRLGKYYPAYHCSHHGHYYRVPKDKFEDIIMNFVERVTISPERFDEVAAAIMQVWEQRQTQVQDDMLLRGKKREEYEAEIRIIVDKMKIVSSPTALKFMEEDIAKLEQQIVDLETRDDEIESKEGVDMAKILTYLRYFVEHMKDLLIDHSNPILRARYFGIIFDKVPSLADIECGTTEIEKIPGVNELFKLAHSKDISLVQSTLCILRKVVDVVFALPKRNRQHKLTLGYILKPKGRELQRLQMCLVEQIHNLPAVDTVSGKSIRVPRDNPASFAGFNASKH